MTKEKLEIARRTLIALVSKLKDGSLFNVFGCDPLWSFEGRELNTCFRQSIKDSVIAEVNKRFGDGEKRQQSSLLTSLMKVFDRIKDRTKLISNNLNIKT